MAIPSLVDRLAKGESLFVGWVGLPEPLVAELVARTGFDAVCLEGQHALLTDDAIMRGVSAVALAEKPAIVRIPVGNNALASHVLDMGAQAVIAPMINTAEDARAFVAATKYPPVGERSWGPARTITLHGVDMPTQLATANARTLAIAMVETPTALANLDDILAVEGIDGIFMGPSDLSVTLSRGTVIDPFSPELDEPIRRIAEKTAAAGKIPCAFAATPERARQFREIGYRMVAIASDQVYLATGIKSLLAVANQPAD